MASYFVSLHRHDGKTVVVNPQLVRLVGQDQTNLTTIYFKAHNKPKETWLQVTETIEQVLSAFNEAMGSGGTQAFAKAHDKWINQRYAFNPALLQAISQDDKGITFLAFDGLEEVDSHLTISETVPEIITECNRAMQARLVDD